MHSSYPLRSHLCRDALVMVAGLSSLGCQAFSEAPELAAKVAAGELAPVEHRLPENERICSA